jgi:hypothetical protein
MAAVQPEPWLRTLITTTTTTTINNNNNLRRFGTKFVFVLAKKYQQSLRFHFWSVSVRDFLLSVSYFESIRSGI